MSQASPAASRVALADSSGQVTSPPVPASTPAPAPKLRSCVVCRTRKVRCDKLSPCSNCRRANIPCVVPSNDRPPRWARRLERITNNAATSAATPPQPADPGADQVMDRLRSLEGLVKELSSQLEQANAAAASARAGSSGTDSVGLSPNEQGGDQQANSSSGQTASGIHKHFGRLVLQDASGGRYVSSGFWSRVSDELDGLKMDTEGLPSGDSDSSEDEDSPGKTPSTQELDRTPSERHSFLFRHNLNTSTTDIRSFRPLPSQIPFLVNTYEENVNFFYRIVHIPTLTKLIRETRGAEIPPANEALLFSIYYAAITSMEEEDVMTNFGSTKADLNLKYRLGLEYSLAKADFLNSPDLTTVQAFTIFLFLVRRHDSPRFVWMMTGLLIRMAQAIGLHRDGSNFKHLTPYEVEMRRRTWKCVCSLDIRASEDQGSDLIITSSNSDTRLPLNINESDISPETKDTPEEREGVADMSIALVSFEICEVVKKIMTSGSNLEHQSQLLSTVYEGLERRYLRYSTELGNIAYWVGVTATRLVISKLTLFIYLPALFSNPDEHFSEEIKNKLLVAAIECAEYNHALNAEEACRQWRWLYQTYAHWHAVVYLLIETSRRQWSPMVERAWLALHSTWLIPSQANLNKNLRVWIPLRKLMAKAQRHREAELERIRGNASITIQLERDDQRIPVPGSSCPFTSGKGVEPVLEHWRNLVKRPTETNDQQLFSSIPQSDDTRPSVGTQDSVPQPNGINSGSGFGGQNVWPNTSFAAGDTPSTSQSGRQGPFAATPSQISTGKGPDTSFPSGQTPFSVPADWVGGHSIAQGPTPWLWADTDFTLGGMDMNMDLDTDVNWNNWLESAASMDLNFGTDKTGGSWPRPTS